MENLSDPDIISNEAFVNAYDALAINQAAKSSKKRISWEKICDIFNKLKVPLLPVPNDKVSQSQKLILYLHIHINHL